MLVNYINKVNNMNKAIIIVISVCVGIDVANYSHHSETGVWLLNMDSWFNSPVISVINLIVIAVFVIADRKTA